MINVSELAITVSINTSEMVAAIRRALLLVVERDAQNSQAVTAALEEIELSTMFFQAD